MGDTLWDFAPWGRVGEAPYMGFCPLGSGRGGSLWDFAPWHRVGSGWGGSLWETPYGILPPGVGLERLPMGFCPLG